MKKRKTKRARFHLGNTEIADIDSLIAPVLPPKRIVLAKAASGISVKFQNLERLEIELSSIHTIQFSGYSSTCAKSFFGNALVPTKPNCRVYVVGSSHRGSEVHIEMGSGEENVPWSAFDRVKNIPSMPEPLMAEINAAIAALECARATALLDSPSSSLPKNTSSAANKRPHYDARMADEAYKAGCAALAAGKLDEALHSLNVALAKCPPDKTSAVAKLQSLISLTSQQLQKPPN